MRIAGLFVTTVITLWLFAGLRSSTSQPISFQEAQAPSASSEKKIPVYVTNFELDVAPVPSAQRRALLGPNPPQPGAKAEPLDPAQLASHLVDTMSMKLVEALQKTGYPVQRLRPQDDRPNYGVQIRGIFTEVDAQNHWTRAVIRSGSDNGKMNALIAVGNLARPDQALYEIADLPGNTNRPGAIITLSPYVPLERYEISKDADDKAFAGIASQVIADLDALLSKNPPASPE